MYISVESGKDNIRFLQEEWSSSLNEDINFKMVVKVFKNAKTTNAPSVYQHFKQYRQLDRRTVHTHMQGFLTLMLMVANVANTKRCKKN